MESLPKRKSIKGRRDLTNDPNHTPILNEYFDELTIW